jgi:hypothetical protein
MGRLVALVGGVSVITLAATPAALAHGDAAAGERPGNTHTVATHTGGWQPPFKAAKRFARGRAGQVRFAVIDQFGRMRARRGAATAPMASLFKALVLATYLSRPNVRDRSLHEWERDLLGPMIKRSANEPATRLRDMLGAGPIVATARRAGMRDFSYHAIWGLSRTSARDQARFFFRWDRFVPKRHERYARHLLSHIVPSQRWGVGKARPRGWELFFKGGWGVGDGRVNHQTAFLERGRCRLALSVMTEYSPGHRYGTKTIEGIAERLTNGIHGAHCGRRIAHGGAQAVPQGRGR